MGSVIWPRSASAIAASSTSFLVTSTATISPLTASTPICSLRQDRRRDVPCFSTSHSPAPPSFSPVLSTSKCSGPVAARRGGHLQRLRPPAQRGVVRHREVKPEQTDDRADEPLGLPQRQAKDHAYRQRRGDRQGRIVRLAAWRGSRLRSPRLDRLVGKPNGQAAPPLQGSIILRPIRDPIPGLGDMMAVFGMVFERQGG